jgi:hypothetical protein
MAEAARIDTSGKLLIGTTHNSLYNSSTQAHAGALIDGVNDNIQVARWEGTPLFVNRMSTDGNLVDFRKDGAAVGIIGTVSGGLSIGSGDTGLYFESTSNEIRPFDTTSNASIDAAIDLGNSTKRFKDLYLSGGVVFGATGGAVTSKTLDDYETGTFTPVLSDAQTGGNTATGSSILGTYTKVGNVVHVTIRAINITTGGMTAGNDLHIQGLPFTQNGTFNFMGAIAAADITFSGFLTLYGSGGTTVAKVSETVSATGIDFITIGDLTSGSADLQAVFTYQIS